MIHYQCLGCRRLHPLQAPAFCQCGSTTFTALHDEEPDEAPSTSPEGRAVRDLAEGLAQAFGEPVEVVESSFGPAAVASTSGPTPPPSVASSSSGSASAPKPGAADEPDDELAHDVGGVVCGQQGCDKPATHKYFWPSPGEPATRYACERHAQVAADTAPALGFSADVQPLER